jgi:hypothetical protein
MPTIHHRTTIACKIFMKYCVHCARSTVDDSEEHIISEKLARAVMAQGEFALVGNESVPNNETPYVIVDGEATTTLTSSFENCADIKPKKVNINLAEGRIAMVTTHVCLKTHCFRSRTGEIRAVTTQAFVVPSLRTDLLSVKLLNFQGYCVMHHPNPEESGLFQLIEGKMDCHGQI